MATDHDRYEVFQDGAKFAVRNATSGFVFSARYGTEQEAASKVAAERRAQRHVSHYFSTPCRFTP